MTRMAARGRYDYTLLTVLGILVLSGLIILYSTSAYNGEVKFCDSSYYLKKQVFATCLGFLAMFFTAQLDYHRLKNIAWLCYLVALLLSIAVIFVGREYRFQALACTWSTVISTIGICKGCGYFISGFLRHTQCEKNVPYADIDKNHDSRAADSRIGRSQ